MSPDEIDMVRELSDCGELSDWEYDFINDLAIRPVLNPLSDSQTEKLSEIYDEYF